MADSGTFHMDGSHAEMLRSRTFLEWLSMEDIAFLY